MDLLRSCYTTFMRFFTDDPLEIKVRWFWADEEAGIWPGHHRFGSGNWASDKFDWPGPGEVLGAPRVWDSGFPIDGLIGDHYCGPALSYIEGTPYPGVPLNALPDGRCVCCVPVPPVCAELVAPLPATLRLRIENIVIDPDTGLPSLYTVGTTFDMVRSGPPGSGYFISPLPFRNGCGDPVLIGLGCFPIGDDTVLSLVQSNDVVHYPPTLITEAPFRAWYSGFLLTPQACAGLGDGNEFWDVVIYDPADPPPTP